MLTAHQWDRRPVIVGCTSAYIRSATQTEISAACARIRAGCAVLSLIHALARRRSVKVERWHARAQTRLIATTCTIQVLRRGACGIVVVAPSRRLLHTCATLQIGFGSVCLICGQWLISGQVVLCFEWYIYNKKMLIKLLIRHLKVVS